MISRMHAIPIGNAMIVGAAAIAGLWLSNEHPDQAIVVAAILAFSALIGCVMNSAAWSGSPPAKMEPKKRKCLQGDEHGSSEPLDPESDQD